MTELTKIACIGECMVELSLGAQSNTDNSDGQNGNTCRLGFAGDTFNTAVYLKRAAADAVDVSYVTVVGKDALSDRMIDLFVAEQLNIDHVARHDERVAGLYAISTDASGERSFTYWRDQAAARTLFDADCAIDIGQLYAFDMVYYSAITLAVLSDDTRRQLMEWLPHYRKRGGLVAFDSNYRPKLWPSQKAAQASVTEAWSNCDIALPSADDEMDLFGDASPAAVQNRIRQCGVTRGALKNGPTGPLVFDEGVVIKPLPEADQVVDTTAAGDSFNGGYLAAIATGQSPGDAAIAGHNTALHVIAHHGAIVPRNV